MRRDSRPLWDPLHPDLLAVARYWPQSTMRLHPPGAPISSSSRATLLPSAWLTDQIVEAFLSTLDAPTGPRTVGHLDAALLGGYIDRNPSDDQISRWFRRRRLWRLDIVLAPICWRSHWSLVAFLPGRRQVVHVDSLPGLHQDVPAFALRIADAAPPGTPWALLPLNIPPQLDSCSCGPAACLSASALASPGSPPPPPPSARSSPSLHPATRPSATQFRRPSSWPLPPPSPGNSRPS